MKVYIITYCGCVEEVFKTQEQVDEYFKQYDDKEGFTLDIWDTETSTIVKRTSWSEGI